MPYNVLDLFSGIGGFSLALGGLGCRTVAFCEKDKACAEILEKHWPGIPIFKDIKTLNADDIKDRVDIITGGFPCQDISFAGAGLGITEGTRSGLWSEYARLINEIRPKYCIIENVEYIRKRGLSRVLRDLSRIGYDAEWYTIGAYAAGFPHQRRRTFILSYPSSERLYEYPREKRLLQANQKREDKAAYCERKQRESKLIPVRPILSPRTFASIRATYPDGIAPLSDIRRVTNGIPEKLDEAVRKQRIKQLGNSIVPRVAEIIGKAILKSEL